MSVEISAGMAAAYAGMTQALTSQAIGMEVMKTQFESQQAVAGMLMEQAVQLRALTYNDKGQAIQPVTTTIDTHV